MEPGRPVSLAPFTCVALAISVNCALFGFVSLLAGFIGGTAALYTVWGWGYGVIAVFSIAALIALDRKGICSAVGIAVITLPALYILLLLGLPGSEFLHPIFP